MSHIQFTTLDNGLRVITDTVPDVHSVALGVWVNVGTRNEDPKYNGAAHMVEHMLFKGTPTRSTQQIAEIVEDVGGNINAYTSREMTSLSHPSPEKRYGHRARRAGRYLSERDDARG
jgi:predicted Zn-dependent peptidase